MGERNYKLYVHISPSNKRYYGITCQERCEDRWKNGNAYKQNKHFTRAINKYSWDNFQHIVLFDNLTKEEACLLEQCYIALYDTFDGNYGYNQSLGGEHGLASEQTKKKLSEAKKGKNKTEETKKKISEAHIGITHTEETKKKISEAIKGENNPRYGKGRPVLMFTKEGEFIRMFECVPDANEFLGKPRNNINIAVCARGTNTTAWGYKWIYEEDYIKEQQQAI